MREALVQDTEFTGFCLCWCRPLETSPVEVSLSVQGVGMGPGEGGEELLSHPGDRPGVRPPECTGESAPRQERCTEALRKAQGAEGRERGQKS